jgi:hypothetical protein
VPEISNKYVLIDFSTNSDRFEDEIPIADQPGSADPGHELGGARRDRVIDLAEHAQEGRIGGQGVPSDVVVHGEAKPGQAGQHTVRSMPAGQNPIGPTARPAPILAEPPGKT